MQNVLCSDNGLNIEEIYSFLKNLSLDDLKTLETAIKNEKTTRPKSKTKSKVKKDNTDPVSEAFRVFLGNEQ